MKAESDQKTASGGTRIAPLGKQWRASSLRWNAKRGMCFREALRAALECVCHFFRKEQIMRQQPQQEPKNGQKKQKRRGQMPKQPGQQQGDKQQGQKGPEHQEQPKQ